MRISYLIYIIITYHTINACNSKNVNWILIIGIKRKSKYNIRVVRRKHKNNQSIKGIKSII
jgi:hypothetical protein